MILPWLQNGLIRCMHLFSHLKITGEHMNGEEGKFNIFEMSENSEGEPMLKHMKLGTESPVEVRQNQSVNGPLAVLNDYYDVYVTCPDDAQYRFSIGLKRFMCRI